MRARESITADAIPAILDELGSPWGTQLDLDLIPWEPAHGGPRAGYRVRLRWAGRSYEFVAECKSRSTPRAIDQALLQARRASLATGLAPMIIVPYLDERRLDRLADEAVAGIDLSGNGIAIVPGRLLLRRSGRPNRYPESQPTKYAYRGATSVVPRVFLCQPQFESVSAIKEAIEARGGSVALSTVSKALARMTEDVLIERAGSRITLIQPDSLLERLRDDFRSPPARATMRVNIVGPLASLFKQANEQGKRPRLVLSGSSSQDRYSAGIRTDEVVAYCERLKDIRDRVGDRWEESERFADLAIIETGDRTPFFDARSDESGLVYASPIQSYLELAAGDTRDREMAEQIRESILGDVHSGSRSHPGYKAATPLRFRGPITLADLREFREDILDVADRHGASTVRVFGSVARGTAGADSDVDLLVEFADDRSLFDQIALIQDLTELLHHPVDVVSDRGLNPRIRTRVLEEAIAL